MQQSKLSESSSPECPMKFLTFFVIVAFRESLGPDETSVIKAVASGPGMKMRKIHIY